MKRKLYSLLVLLIILVSCTILYYDAPKPYVHIRVGYDSTFIGGSLDQINFSYEGEFIEGPESYLDPEADTVRVKWDSTRTGHYTIEMRSIFLDSYQIEYEINSDTILFVPNRFPFVQVDTLTPQELYTADTVECVFVRSGCFHFQLSRISLIRKGNEYMVYTKEDSNLLPGGPQIMSMEMGKGIIANMYMAFLTAEQYSPEYFSTSSQRFYLRADGKVYRFYDQCAQWQGYDLVF